MTASLSRREVLLAGERLTLASLTFGTFNVDAFPYIPRHWNARKRKV